jgi:hypothetical protein
MLYYDRVYGKLKITAPVILDLIKSPSLQRLKEVEQAGYSPLYFQLHSLTRTKEVNRFEHSVGVFLLLRKFGASLAEQVAGLIHDVSHSAFSHTIDYIFDSGSPSNHDYQDKIHEEFVKNTEIPGILEKYQFNIDYILNEKNFPLKERDLPDLCADRIDYSLRNTLGYRVTNKERINYFLQNLTTEKNFWVFKNFQSAKDYAELFLKLNTVHYAGFPTAVMFQTMADLLKHALGKGYINKKDLYTTDKAVLGKIKKHMKNDQKLKLLFKRISGKVKFKNSPRHFDVHVYLKSRVVDPLFKTDGKFKRVSQVKPIWAKIIKAELKPKEYFIKFISDSNPI